MSQEKQSASARVQAICGAKHNSTEDAKAKAAAFSYACLRLDGASALVLLGDQQDPGRLSPDESTALLCLLEDAHRALFGAWRHVADGADVAVFDDPATDLICAFEGLLCLVGRASRDEDPDEGGLCFSELLIVRELLDRVVAKVVKASPLREAA